MNTVSKLVIALAAATTGGVAIASDLSSDQQRRERNREEAIANWERQQAGHESMANHHDRQATDRHEGHMSAHGSVQENSKVASEKTRSFTHRQLEKVRDFGERQEARLPGPANPVQEPNKAPVAIGK
jgi:hypothetical protein